MRRATFIVALALVPTITEAATTQRARYLMGTVCEVAAAKPEQIDLAFAEAKRVESMLSTWIDSSELSRVNRGETEASPELRALLDKTLAWSEKTNRAFDPRIAHLVVPFRSAVERQATSPPSAGGLRARRSTFEEGAFGKGYALDRMLALIDGEAMLNFGGQILVRGAREVSVADPEHRQTPALTLRLENASLSTSAGHHIFDPRTGELLPPRGSASVIAPDALTADILSTALFVMGDGEGLRWAAANGVAAIFIDNAHHIRLSPAARKLGVAVLSRDFTVKE